VVEGRGVEITLVKAVIHIIANGVRKLFQGLCSKWLALSLMVVILGAGLVATVFLSIPVAQQIVFRSLWFNGFLVLLVLNTACCFFSRLNRRNWDLVFIGIVIFHLSFVSIFGGVVYNSLFYFRGAIRLTEGETLPNGQPQSYDHADRGRFFNNSKLKGETTLIGMQTNHKVDGTDKGVAYEIAVGEGSAKKQGFVYITKNLDYNGFRYFNDKEGYSLLIVLYDKQGGELYGAYVPLQSLKQKDGKYLYTTGTKEGPGSFPFPQDPPKLLFDLQAAYHPDPKKERAGEVFFQVWPLRTEHEAHGDKILASGKAAIGEKFDAGDYYLSVKEVRYWASMNVRHDPGLTLILASLWMGLGGIIFTTVARLIKKK
jgi:hypothetical protein